MLLIFSGHLTFLHFLFPMFNVYNLSSVFYFCRGFLAFGSLLRGTQVFPHRLKLGPRWLKPLGPFKFNLGSQHFLLSFNPRVSGVLIIIPLSYMYFLPSLHSLLTENLLFRYI